MREFQPDTRRVDEALEPIEYAIAHDDSVVEQTTRAAIDRPECGLNAMAWSRDLHLVGSYLEFPSSVGKMDN
jgi:hypothetical protein